MVVDEVTPTTPWSRFSDQFRSFMHKKFHKPRSTSAFIKGAVVGAFPILDWLPHYDIRKCLVGDLISGFTVGILNIPQGMAYGVLAGTDSIYGLYASFFPVLMYSLICTSHHASVGTFAVISLMTGGIVHSVAPDLWASRQNGTVYRPIGADLSTNITIESIPLDVRVDVMLAVTLATGVWQMLFGIFRFGYLAVFLSDHLVKGFTCAAAFHVFTSQVRLVFGMPRLKERYGPLKLIYFYYDFFAQITTTHVPTLIVSIICITILYLIRTFVNQNPTVMKVIKIPIPIELLVIIFSTLASYYLKLETDYGVSTVRSIPTGLPAPRVPPYQIIPDILGRTFSVAIVGGAVLISLSKIFATKHGYKIDANQELIALGAANVFGTFFLCIPTTGALARSAVQESVGGSTQMVSIVSALIVLIVLLALGTYLQPLPRAVLGSIIMVALLGMLRQVMEVGRLWKISLIDCSIFLVTLLATLLLDVDLGLAIGVLYSLLTFAFRLQYGKVDVIGRVRGTTDDLKPVKADPRVDEITGTKVFRLHGPLYSGNAEKFVSRVRRAIDRRESERPLLAVTLPEEVPHVRASVQLDSIELDELSGIHRRTSSSSPDAGILSEHRESLWNGDGGMPASLEPLKTVVIDCSAINFVDIVGAEQMKILVKECGKKGIQLIFAACADNVRDLLILAGVQSMKPAPLFASSVTEAVDYRSPNV